MLDRPQKLFLFAPEIHPPFIEGVQKTAWSFAREFARQGHTVEVATIQSYGERFEEKIQQGVRVGYWFSTYQIRFLKYVRWFFQSCALVRRIQREKPSLIIVFSLDLPFFMPLALLSLLSDRPKIILSVFSWRELTGLGKIFLKFFSGRIDRYKVRSEFMQRELLKRGIGKNKIETILPFPNKEKFLLADTPIVRSLGSVAYFSNVDYAAGVGTMLDIARRLPALKFTIAVRKFSDEYERQVAIFADTIRRENLANVDLVRTLPDIAVFFKQTECVILPVLDMSSTMDVPMVLIEALASGCRVFVHHLPIFSWLVEAGYVEEFQTIDELAQKLSTPRPPDTYEAVEHFIRSLPVVQDSVEHYLT